MYGMLLESVQHFVQKLYGEEIWTKILKHINMGNTVFTPHARYSDTVMVKIAQACTEIIGQNQTPNHHMRFFGRCFVGYFTHYGYDRILRVSGRHFRDLLHGIDNLHETMRFSYPKMRNPSFYVEHEDSKGCILHYRSKRRGFTQYVAGQLEQCANTFYNLEIEIIVLKEDFTDKGCHITYRLNFDNSAFKPKLNLSTGISSQYKSIPANVFFKIFPYCIVFDESLHIRHIGPAIKQLFAHETLIGAKIKDKFLLRRPLMEFTWINVVCLQRVVFELRSLIHTRHSISTGILKTLLLKGQMKYNKDLGGMAFLCAPLMSGVEELQAVGLYINELNMYDSSREMVIAGCQHASQLEYSIEKQVAKSKQIEESLKRLDEEKQLCETILYSMIPESIAVRLKNGDNPMQTCEMFDQVTIMFGYIIGFTELCSGISAICLVQCINKIFETIDKVLKTHDVFKVETLGDAVYMIAGGLPDRTPDHAYNVASVGLKLVEQVKDIEVPSDMAVNKLQLRVGIHSGSVVAGVVGIRMPQYCLFGDTVNTASRMQTHSQASRIHISESSYKHLKKTDLVMVYRGKIHMKGKGDMSTYWLAGHKCDKELRTTVSILKSEASSHTDIPLESETTLDSYQFRKTDTIHDLLNRQAQTRQYSSSIKCKLPRNASHPGAEVKRFVHRTASHPTNTTTSYLQDCDLLQLDKSESKRPSESLLTCGDSNTIFNVNCHEHLQINLEDSSDVTNVNFDGENNRKCIVDYSYFDMEPSDNLTPASDESEKSQIDSPVEEITATKIRKESESRKLGRKFKNTFSDILSHCSFSLCIDGKLQNDQPISSSENLMCSSKYQTDETVTNIDSLSDIATECDSLLSRVNKDSTDNKTYLSSKHSGSVSTIPHMFDNINEKGVQATTAMVTQGTICDSVSLRTKGVQTIISSTTIIDDCDHMYCCKCNNGVIHNDINITNGHDNSG